MSSVGGCAPKSQVEMLKQDCAVMSSNEAVMGDAGIDNPSSAVDVDNQASGTNDAAKQSPDESAAAQPAASAPDANDEGGASEPKRKLRLNPTADQSQLRARPSLGAEDEE